MSVYFNRFGLELTSLNTSTVTGASGTLVGSTTALSPSASSTLLQKAAVLQQARAVAQEDAVLAENARVAQEAVDRQAALDQELADLERKLDQGAPQHEEYALEDGERSKAPLYIALGVGILLAAGLAFAARRRSSATAGYRRRKSRRSRRR